MIKLYNANPWERLGFRAIIFSHHLIFGSDYKYIGIGNKNIFPLGD